MTNIEKLVREAGSQQALASAIGVCQQAVGQWERKGYVPVSRIPIVVDKYPRVVTMQALIDDYIRLYKKNISNKRNKIKIEVVDKKPDFINEPNPAP